MGLDYTDLDDQLQDWKPKEPKPRDGCWVLFWWCLALTVLPMVITIVVFALTFLVFLL